MPDRTHDHDEHAGQGGETKTLEQHLEARLQGAKPNEHHKHRTEYAAVRGLMGGHLGHEMTEADYEQAVHDAMNFRIG